MSNRKQGQKRGRQLIVVALSVALVLALVVVGGLGAFAEDGGDVAPNTSIIESVVTEDNSTEPPIDASSDVFDDTSEDNSDEQDASSEEISSVPEDSSVSQDENSEPNSSTESEEPQDDSAVLSGSDASESEAESGSSSDSSTSSTSSSTSEEVMMRGSMMRALVAEVDVADEAGLLQAIADAQPGVQTILHLSSLNITAPITIDGGKNIVLSPGTAPSAYAALHAGGLTGPTFTVSGEGSSLAMSGTLTLYGHDNLGNNKSSGRAVVVGSGASFSLAEGSIIGYYSAGGVMVQSGGYMSMTGGEICQSGGNDCVDYGGGIHVAAGGSLDMSGGKIHTNTAAHGAGIYMAGTGVFSGTGRIFNNGTNIGYSGKGHGGGLVYPMNANVSITVQDSFYFDANTAGGGGGGIGYLYASDTAGAKPVININGGTFAANTGENYGGGIAASANTTLNITGGVFVQNAAPGDNDSFTPVNARGGAIMTQGTLNVSGGTFTENTAGAGGGIAIYGDAGANPVFTMTGGTISKNTLPDNVPLGGGGVYVAGSASFVMQGGTITQNNAISGAGISLYSGGSATLKGGTISNNKMVGLEDNPNSAAGGGVLVLANSTLNVEGGTITGNKAGVGGGVLVKANGTMTMTSGTISLNGATGGNGGGVFLESGAKAFTLSGGNIIGNTAETHGGGIYANPGVTAFTLSGGNIKENTAKVFGGGVYAGSSLTLSGSQITFNSTDILGGGVYVNSGATMDMTSGTISTNTATQSGGGVYVNSGGTLLLKGGKIDTNEALVGGGVYVNQAATLTMTGGEISTNEASNGAGVGSEYLTDAADPIMSFSGGEIKNNVAESRGGGVVYRGTAASFAFGSGIKVTGNTAGIEGGGLWIENKSGDLTLAGGTISGNTAPVGGGVEYIGKTSAGDKKLVLNGVTISKNSATDATHAYGGGVRATWDISAGSVTNHALIEVKGTTTISENTAAFGGGIYGGAITMSGGTITKNKVVSVVGTEARGGGIYSPSSFTMSGGTISYNETTGAGLGKGGGLYVAYGQHANQSVTLTGGSINNNKSIGEAGGLLTYSDLNMSGTAAIKDNTAGAVGGGLMLNGGTTNITGGTIRGNSSSTVGGGIYVRNISINVSGATLTGNSALQGGGIYVGDTGQMAYLKLTDITMQGNSATDKGGEIYINERGRVILCGKVVVGSTEGTTSGIYSGYTDPDIPSIVIGDAGSDRITVPYLNTSSIAIEGFAYGNAIGDKVAANDSFVTAKPTSADIAKTFQLISPARGGVPSAVSGEGMWVIWGESDREIINANDFKIRLSTLKSAGVSDANLKQWMEATAHKNDTANTPLTLTVSHSVPSTPVEGSYPITFSTASGISKTVTLTVYDGEYIEINAGIALVSDTVRISLAELQALKNKTMAERRDRYAELGDAHAWRTETNAAVNVLSIDDTDALGREPLATGTFDLVFSTNANAAQPTRLVVPMEVYDALTSEPPATNPEKSVGIGANNIWMSVQEVLDHPNTAGADNKYYVDKAGAKGWNTADPVAQLGITITANTSAIQPTPGQYNLVFNGSHGKSVTVKANVYDNLYEGPYIKLYANNIFLSVAEAKTLIDKPDDAKLTEYITRSGAGIWGQAAVYSYFKDTGIKAEPGTYTVSLSIANKYTAGDSISFSVLVRENIGDGIAGNNFNIPLNQVATLKSAATADSVWGTMAGIHVWDTQVPARLGYTLDRSKVEAKVGTYPVKFTAQHGGTVTVYATVHDGTVPVNGMMIDAHDFIIDLDNWDTLAQSGNAGFISAAGGRAWYTNAAGPNATNNLNDKISFNLQSAVKAKGEYKVKLSVAVDGVQGPNIEVTMIVRDNAGPSGTNTIGANDFEISVADLDTLLNDTPANKLKAYVGYAKAVALDAGGNTVSIGSFKEPAGLTAEPGEYTIKFCTQTTFADAQSVSVKMTVYDEIYVSGERKIMGNHFTVDIEDVPAMLVAGKDAAWGALGSVKVIDDLTGKTGYTANYSAVQAKIGTYPVVFIPEYGTEADAMTLMATVVNGEVVVKDGVAIYAHDFMVGVSEWANLEALAKARAEAVAWDKSKPGPSSTNSLDPAFIPGTAKAAAGEYDVTFIGSIASFHADKEVVMTVRDKVGKPKDPTDPSDVYIGANDIVMSTAEMETLLANNAAGRLGEYIRLSDAVALHVDGSRDDIRSYLEDAKLAAEPGEYTLKLSTETTFNSDKSVSITVTVYDEIDEKGARKIMGNHFAVELDKVAGLKASTDPTDWGKLAGVKTVDTTASPNLSYTVGHASVQEAVGTYPVSFSMAGTGAPSITVFVTVWKDVPPKDGLMITANDFIVELSDMPLLSADYIQRSGALYWFDNEAGPSPTNSFTSGLSCTPVDTVKTAVGDYRLKFTATEGTATNSITVTMMVRDNTGPSGPDTIGANDFEISVDALETLLKGSTKQKLDAYVGYAKAVALDASGEFVDIKTFSEPSGLKAVPGEYTIKFCTQSPFADAQSVSVKMTVYDKMVPPEGKQRIMGNDISIHIDDVPALLAAGKSAEWGALGSVKVVDEVTNKTGYTANYAGVQAKIGTYDVVFTPEYGTAADALTLAVTVYDKVPPLNGLMVDAHDFMIELSEWNDLATGTNAGFILRAGAQGWKTSEPGPSSTNSVGLVFDLNGARRVAGDYTVYFTAKDGAVTGPTIGVTMTVRHNVKKPDTKDPLDKTYIGANDYDITRAEMLLLQTQNADARLVDYIARSRAVAMDADGVAMKVLSFDDSDLSAELGAHTLKLSTGSTFAEAQSVAVTVTVYDAIQPPVDPPELEDGERYIAGNNFVMTVDEVKALKASSTHADWGALASVKVVDTTINPKTSYTADHSKVQPAVATYKLVFTPGYGTAADALTVFVTVTDGDGPIIENNKAINAHDFIIDKDEWATLVGNDSKNAGFIDRAGAVAWDITKEGPNASNSLPVTFDPQSAIAEQGDYRVKFSTADGPSIEVTMTVRDNISPPIGTKEVRIGANDFDITVADMAVLLAKSNSARLADYIKLTSAIAKDNTGAIVGILSCQDIYLKAEVGEYTLRLSTASSFDSAKSVTVNVNVRDHMVVDGEQGISGNDFILPISQYDSFTPDDYIDAARVKVWDTATTTEQKVELVDTSKMRKEVGSYLVSYTGSNNKVLTVSVTVSDDNTYVDLKKKEAVFAKNFTVYSHEMAELAESSNAGYIQRAEAKAWSIAVDTIGESLPLSFDIGKATAKPGVYKVSFSTANGTRKTVNMTVLSGDVIVIEDDVTLVASHFRMSVPEVEAGGLTLEEYVARAAARAWVTGEGDAVDILSFDDSEIKAQAGVYSFVLSTNKDPAEPVRAEVSVEVFDNLTYVPGTDDELEDDKGIGANNFAMTTDEVGKLDDDTYIERAKATTWDRSATIPPTVVDVDDKDVGTKPDTYPIVFTSSNGESVTAYVTVTDDDTVVDFKVQEAIYATDFTVEAGEMDAWAENDNAGYIAAASARAWKTNALNTSLPVKFYIGDAKRTEGTYFVSFATEKGTRRTVLMTVVTGDNYTVNPPVDPEDPTGENTGEAIQANDFIIAMVDVPLLTSEGYIQQAQAKAWTTDGENTPVSIAVDYSDMKPYPGEYTVIYKTPAGTTVSVKVTVVISNFTVTFDYGPAGGQKPVSVPYSDKITKPEDPSLIGHSFGGWVDSNGKQWNFDDPMPDKNFKLTAVWTVNNYKLTYMNDWEVVAVYEDVPYNTELPFERAPQNAPQDHVFMYWQEQGVEHKWIFETDFMPAYDLTLKAIWRHVPPEVSSTSRSPISSRPSSSSSSSSSVSSSSVSDGGYIPEQEVITSSSAGGGAIISQSQSSQVMISSISQAASQRSETSLGTILNPLAPGNNNADSWALFNLLLAMLSAVGGVYLLVKTLLRKSGNGPMWPMAGIMLAVVSVLVFMFTDAFKMNLEMVYVNRWTLLLLVFAMGEVLTLLMAARGKHVDEEDTDEFDDAYTAG